jgi:hypothetical protein
VMDVLYWVLLVVSLALVCALVRHAMRRARALDDRISEFHDEQDNPAPGPVNPYADMSNIFGANPPPEDEEKK